MVENNIEITVLWCLTGGAVGIMLSRLFLRLYRNQRLEIGEYLTIAAIVSILLRGSTIHVALDWGTNRGLTKAQVAKLTPQELYQHEVGAKLTVANRVFYGVYTWLQKCVVMVVLQRLLRGVKSERIVNIYWISLGVSFIATFVVNFTDCNPFANYYRLTPNPGSCSKGMTQLWVFSIFNMITDIMLIILPLPQLMKIQRPIAAKLRLIALFLVGFSIVAVTLTRLLMNVIVLGRAGASHHVANVEIFFAAVVANTPTIYGLLNMGKGGGSATTGHNYLPQSWSGSKSLGGEGRYANMSRSNIEMNRRPGGGPGSRNDMESDEEMILEYDSLKTSNVRVAAKPAV